MSDMNNGAPIPPEGMDQSARQEAADAAYGRAQAAANRAGMDAGKARAAEAEAKKARKEAEAAERAAMKEERAKAKEQKKKDGKGGSSFGKSFAGGAAGALCVVLVAGVLCAYTPVDDAFRTTSGSSNGGTITVENSDDATLAQAVSAKCLDSVVTIYIYSANSSWSQYFQSGDSSSKSSPNGLGSGVIIKSDSDKSYVLTNYHVLEDCSKATISINGQTYNCTPVGYDSTADLAVVTIPVGGLTVAEWGDSGSLTVGEWCMAIGSPMGYENTCTTGIVSAVGRNGEVQDGSNTYYNSDVIQTDAAINPGNSGGALVDDEGKVIGIVEYLASNSSANAGLGFAIPQSTAQKIAEEIMQNGTVHQAFLGVVASDGTTQSDDGLEVSAVVKDSAADKAGVKAGDKITKINDSKITSYSDLKSALSSCMAGDKVTITFTHDGKEKTGTSTFTDDSIDTETYSSQLKDSSSNSGNGNGNQSQGNGYGYSDYYQGLQDLFNSMQGQSDSGSGSNSFWD